MPDGHHARLQRHSKTNKGDVRGAEQRRRGARWRYLPPSVHEALELPPLGEGLQRAEATREGASGRGSPNR